MGTELDTGALMAELSEAYHDKGSRYLKLLAAAYYRKTQLAPHKCVLVESEMPDGRMMYRFTPYRKVKHLLEEDDDSNAQDV
jgi:hypothetical protein